MHLKKVGGTPDNSNEEKRGPSRLLHDPIADCA